MPDVSVIIPTWNRADLLVKAVRSALDQTLPPVEVLVCDDGSTDGSESAVRAIGDPRLRWLTADRAGRPAIPRNRGIRESRGEWLAFLDNDDIWLPEKLEAQYHAATRLNCRATCSNATRCVPDLGDEGDYLEWTREKVDFYDLLRVNQVICSSAMVHKSVFTKAVGFPEQAELKALEDYALWLRVATLTDFAFVANPLLLYRDDVSSSIRRDDVNVWHQRRAVFCDFLKWADQEKTDPRFCKAVRSRLQWDRLNRVVSVVTKPVVRLKKAVLG